MGLRRELTEPWGLVTAGLLGGLGFAVLPGGTAIVAGLGIAAAVYGVKVAAGLLAHRERRDDSRPRLLRPHQGSAADVWLRRAERTVRTLHDQTESPREAAVRSQVGEVDDDASAVLDALRRLAAQATAVEDAQHRIDVPRLLAERDRITGAGGDPAPEQMRAEQQRSLDAIQQQLAVAGRLDEAHGILLAKMQSTAIGLEGLVARLAEVLALSATSGGVDTAHDQIAGLNGELDGLRSGLAETEEISRRALGPQHSPPEPA